jgi:hypothetical protein
MCCLCKKQPRRQKLYKKQLDDSLEINPGDSVLVIDENGKLKKLIMPEFRKNIPATAGTEKVLEILKIFDPNAELETFESVDKRTIN